MEPKSDQDCPNLLLSEDELQISSFCTEHVETTAKSDKDVP